MSEKQVVMREMIKSEGAPSIGEDEAKEFFEERNLQGAGSGEKNSDQTPSFLESEAEEEVKRKEEAFKAKQEEKFEHELETEKKINFFEFSALEVFKVRTLQERDLFKETII